MKNSQWSRIYNQCRICQTTDKKHQGHGYCASCYFNVKYYTNLRFRKRMIENAKKWQKENKESHKESMRKYKKKDYEKKNT
jgi:hypothetical protein